MRSIATVEPIYWKGSTENPAETDCSTAGMEYPDSNLQAVAGGMCAWPGRSPTKLPTPGQWHESDSTVPGAWRHSMTGCCWPEVSLQLRRLVRPPQEDL